MTVEDGRPFCPHCHAPQVRVQLAPEILAARTADTSGAPMSQIAFPHRMPSGLFRIALQAGLLGVIANIIPLGLGMVLTGILAALLYHRAAGQTLPPGRAARLGAVSGAIAFAASTLITVLLVVLLHAQDQFRDFVFKAVEQRAANPQDPNVQAVLQWIHTAQGFTAFLAFMMLGFLFFSVLFSTVGCVIGAVLFRERNRPTF
jgi:hypothetical protein